MLLPHAAPDSQEKGRLSRPEVGRGRKPLKKSIPISRLVSGTALDRLGRKFTNLESIRKKGFIRVSNLVSRYGRDLLKPPLRGPSDRYDCRRFPNERSKSSEHALRGSVGQSVSLGDRLASHSAVVNIQSVSQMRFFE